MVTRNPDNVRPIAMRVLGDPERTREDIIDAIGRIQSTDVPDPHLAELEKQLHDELKALDSKIREQLMNESVSGQCKPFIRGSLREQLDSLISQHGIEVVAEVLARAETSDYGRVNGKIQLTTEVQWRLRAAYSAGKYRELKRQVEGWLATSVTQLSQQNERLIEIINSPPNPPGHPKDVHTRPE